MPYWPLGMEENSLQRKSAKKKHIVIERTTLTSILLSCKIASGSDKSTSAAVTIVCSCQLLPLWFFRSLQPNFQNSQPPPPTLPAPSNPSQIKAIPSRHAQAVIYHTRSIICHLQLRNTCKGAVKVHPSIHASIFNTGFFLHSG